LYVIFQCSVEIWIIFLVDEISDAFKLDAAAFEAKYSFPKPDPAKDAIVTHCMGGGRATKASNALKEMGYGNAVPYMGSFKDWVANGGAVDK
jgi:rhodanese-related sulfurtransferase